MAWRFKIQFNVWRKLLKTENSTYTPSKRIFFFVFYELDTWSQDLNSDFSLKGVKLAKITSSDNYIYSRYDIGFDSRSKFSLPGSSIGKKVIILGVDMSSSVYINNKRKDFLIFGIGPTQRLFNTKLAAETEYSINFSISKRKFCLGLHYNGSNSFLFVNCAKNISIQSKRFGYKKLSFLFRKYCRRFFS